MRRRTAALLRSNVPCVGSRGWLLDAETADGRGEHGGLLQRTRRASKRHNSRRTGFTGPWNSHGQRHGEESRGNDTSERVGRAHFHHWLRRSPRQPLALTSQIKECGEGRCLGAESPLYDNNTQTGRKSHPAWAFFLQCTQIACRLQAEWCEKSANSAQPAGLTVTFAPDSSSFFFTSSAVFLSTFSLMAFGAPSTVALASPRP